MATGQGGFSAAQQNQSDTPQALKSWWNTFKRKTKKDTPTQGPAPPAAGAIFGVPLSQSIRYANVAISLMQEDGSSYTYGYIPIVVAKCGVFLKDKATEVEGIFRLAGSARRMNQLQEVFNTPDKYGKGLDWDGYNVHDAANVLRRYLNNLPEPIVPLDLYEPFRQPLRQHQLQAVGNVDARDTDIGNFDYDGTIETYRNLITKLPPLNRQLLLYILDMLAIFAAKSATNHMTAANLAVIFQPGMLHHPEHNKLPHEYRLSQDVVIFLIDQQDNFLLGMPGTAADEKTKKEIESGPPGAGPASPTRTAGGLGRSVSTTSRSTNSSRLAGIRRNLSVSSRGSRASQVGPVPGTPGTPTPGTPGVHRSNTVPSRKSPGVSQQSRFSKPSESPAATPEAAVSPATQAVAVTTSLAAIQTSAGLPSPEARTESIAPSMSNVSAVRNQSKEHLLGDGNTTAGVTNREPPRRALVNLLRSPGSDDGQQRQPNKLKKRRIPQGTQPSGHSSAASLSAEPEASRSPYTGTARDVITSGDESSRQVSAQSDGAFQMTETAPTPRAETHPASEMLKGKANSSPVSSPQTAEPIRQAHEQSKATESSDLQNDNELSTGNELDGDGNPTKGEKREKRRWRFSVSGKRNEDERRQSSWNHGSSSHLGGSSDADLSKSSTQSWLHGRSTATMQDKPNDSEMIPEASQRRGSRDHSNYTSEERSPTAEPGDRKTPFGWLKQKMAERQEKHADKDRAKSPRRNDAGRGPSSHSLSAAANGDSVSRQRSTDISSEPLVETKEEHRDPEIPAILKPALAPQQIPATDGSDFQPALAAKAQSIPSNSGLEQYHVAHEVQVNPRSTAMPASGLPSDLEDYMNDSDREKLHAAQEAQRSATLDAPESLVAQVGVEDTLAKPSAKDIAIDPAYKGADEGLKESTLETEPTTPKASEANARLNA